MTWLLGDVLLNVDVLIFYSAEMFLENYYLCMLGDLIEGVTSRLLIKSNLSLLEFRVLHLSNL